MQNKKTLLKQIVEEMGGGTGTPPHPLPPAPFLYGPAVIQKAVKGDDYISLWIQLYCN